MQECVSASLGLLPADVPPAAWQLPALQCTANLELYVVDCPVAGADADVYIARQCPMLLV
jgi:hypothetical protein